MEKSPIIDAIKKAGPAVVSIVITKTLPYIERKFIIPYGIPQEGPGLGEEGQGGGQEGEYPPDSFLPFMFPVPPQLHHDTPKKKKIKVGGGSGFIVTSDGVILTNRHVVMDDQAEYTVLTSDGKKYPAKILARDPINDVAILKIEGKNLPVVEIGDSSNLQLGQTVIAIGTALGEFQNTVSTGVVSGLSRYISAQTGFSGHVEELRGLIQTDAAINPGNSGGPLLDIEGEVIGINTAIVFGAQNIGFTIPINNAKKDLADLGKYGRIVKPFLGIRYLIINKELQERNKLPVDYGAIILREQSPETFAIVPGSPAEKAGLKEKDIVLTFNGKKIDEKSTILDQIQNCKVGEKIKLEILRNKKKMDVEITLIERK